MHQQIYDQSWDRTTFDACNLPILRKFVFKIAIAEPLPLDSEDIAGT